MRAKINQCLIVKDFIDNNKKQSIISYTPYKPSLKTCKENNLLTTLIKLRLVRIDLPNRVEVLITNLMDIE